MPQALGERTADRGGWALPPFNDETRAAPACSTTSAHRASQSGPGVHAAVSAAAAADRGDGVPRRRDLATNESPVLLPGFGRRVARRPRIRGTNPAPLLRAARRRHRRRRRPQPESRSQIVFTKARGRDVACFVAQPQCLTRPNAGIQHQGKQHPVPQMLPRIEDRLNLLNSNDFRKVLRCLQLDRPPPLDCPPPPAPVATERQSIDLPTCVLADRPAMSPPTRRAAAHLRHRKDLGGAARRGERPGRVGGCAHSMKPAAPLRIPRRFMHNDSDR